MSVGRRPLSWKHPRYLSTKNDYQVCQILNWQMTNMTCITNLTYIHRSTDTFVFILRFTSNESSARSLLCIFFAEIYLTKLFILQLARTFSAVQIRWIINIKNEQDNFDEYSARKVNLGSSMQQRWVEAMVSIYRWYTWQNSDTGRFFPWRRTSFDRQYEITD